jgi:ABC-type cobalamin/Fe3+-siderophores transport system ATPase subunit
VEQATDATEGAISARSERKLAIQEQQLRLQERLVTLQEEREENLVMSLDLDKMTPWAKDFYLMKQKEIVTRKTTQHASNNEE